MFLHIYNMFCPDISLEYRKNLYEVQSTDTHTVSGLCVREEERESKKEAERRKDSGSE